MQQARAQRWRGGEAGAAWARRVAAVGLTLGLTAVAGVATASETAPASIDTRFDALPSELSSRGRLQGDALPGPDAPLSPVLMIERWDIGPLVMEQPVRVYENDVTVKLRAPGGRSSFATLELVF